MLVSNVISDYFNFFPGDTSLVELARRMLVVCAAHATIAAYIDALSEYRGGLVAQALAAAIRGIIKVYSHLFLMFAAGGAI